MRQKQLLGQMLLSRKIITDFELEKVLEEQKGTSEPLGILLAKLGFIDDEDTVFPELASQLDVDLVSLKETDIPLELIALLPPGFAVKYQVIPVAFKDNFLTVASTRPRDTRIIDGIRVSFAGKIKMVLASRKEIADAIRKYYGVGAETIDQMMGGMPSNRFLDQRAQNIEQLDSDASIAKFINQILREACHDRATDIHIEPYEKSLRVRYRVDGVLIDAQAPPNILYFKDSINSRIKIMSQLDIAEKRLPQDGRFKVRAGEEELDLRVSFLPTPCGESVVIRILSSRRLYNFQELGLMREDRQMLEGLIQKPHGIIFVTGPTGSGKTTTLYACLAHLNMPGKKIITVEDPIEYQLSGITQMQVHPAIGLTFAAGLRSMLRHDPDIMMVGEVRDGETAEIAIRSAMTGHLVFSTLHTNDAVGGIARLLDMGVEPYLITSSVECFIAQRLIRVLCPCCKKPGVLRREHSEDLGFTFAEAESQAVYESRGCAHCQGSGFRGRLGVYEFLPITDDIAGLILSRAPAAQVRARAIARGMKTLIEQGWEKVKLGMTTPGELIRVIKDERGVRA